MGIVGEVLGHRLVRVETQFSKPRFGCVEFRPTQKSAPDAVFLLRRNHRDVLDEKVVVHRAGHEEANRVSRAFHQPHLGGGDERLVVRPHRCRFPSDPGHVDPISSSCHTGQRLCVLNTGAPQPYLFLHSPIVAIRSRTALGYPDQEDLNF